MSTSEDKAAPPSKTQRKRAMAELQVLGEELVELAADRLRKIELPEELRAAVREAQQMLRHDDARRRQLQYIGRVMRDVDPEPIRRALAVVRGESAEATGRLHRLEQLRSDLLADERTLYDIARKSPSVDLQHLRSLRRAALLEQAQGKPPRSYRAIFQLLKALEQSDDVSDGPDEHQQP